MAVSAIISNFNGLKYLPRLIETIKGQSGVDLEIIVVDRKSTDGSVEYIQSLSGVKMITEPPETGLVAGYHAGTSVATKENFFFCNEDMWFEPDCLSRLEKALSPEKRVVAADPWQWSYDGGERIHAGTRFFKSRFSLNSPHPFHSPDFDCDLKSGELVPLPCAGALMIVARYYQEWGGWDGTYFLNHEDTDLFIRGWQRGYHCVTIPEAKVYHACGASNQKMIGKGTLPVGKRRYISNFASMVVLGVKYFTGISILFGAMSTVVRMGANLLRLRFKYLGWDFLVIREVIGRIPMALRFRNENREWIRRKPGQLFFSDPEFLK